MNSVSSNIQKRDSFSNINASGIRTGLSFLKFDSAYTDLMNFLSIAQISVAKGFDEQKKLFTHFSV